MPRNDTLHRRNAMTPFAWRGSFAIPMTPYDDGLVDEAALRDEIQFCLACGVGGLVAPVMVSEFRLLWAIHCLP
jgi:dihydrodipicolinate synthase/N-acetylneuraminate lyase